jgi:hypothetical protein
VLIAAGHVHSGLGYVIYDLDAIGNGIAGDVLLERELEISPFSGSRARGYALVAAALHLPRRNYDGVALGAAGYQCNRAFCAGGVGVAYRDNRGRHAWIGLPFAF